mmetsp:Transcript_31234/g.90795  ORF Transcript_31234/g.90795 Transcript_31234/m.90795 type:complete len:204 (-) Transcript_31234:44-655(-)
MEPHIHLLPSERLDLQPHHHTPRIAEGFKLRFCTACPPPSIDTCSTILLCLQLPCELFVRGGRKARRRRTVGGLPSTTAARRRRRGLVLLLLQHPRQLLVGHAPAPRRRRHGRAHGTHRAPPPRRHAAPRIRPCRLARIVVNEEHPPLSIPLLLPPSGQRAPLRRGPRRLARVVVHPELPARGGVHLPLPAIHHRYLPTKEAH